MNDEQKKTIADITELYTNVVGSENEIQSDRLKFSVWIAAAATAGFGLLLINGDQIIRVSWLPATVGNLTVSGVYVLLTVSILASGLMHHLVNDYLGFQKVYVTLMNAQLARV